MRILDVGCGDGVFSARVAESGAEVIGIDPAPDMVRNAKKRGIDARLCAAEDFDEIATFDHAVSNAALHWIRTPRPALAAIFRALRPGGSFVGEMGGMGNVASAVSALRPALTKRGLSFDTLNPWNFPAEKEWRNDLETVGFAVEETHLFERPTPLPSSITDWLDTFAGAFLSGLNKDERQGIAEEVSEALAPCLLGPDGTWILDYVRLRFKARKPQNIT